MSKRRYTNMQVLLPTIEKMLESGKSHREIEAELGLEGDRPVHNLLKRQGCAEVSWQEACKDAAGI